jgi:hypothetical protein
MSSGTPWASLTANAAFPVILCAALSRGQSVQERYLIAPLLFSIAWNAFVLADRRDAQRDLLPSWAKAARPALPLIVLLVAAGLAVEASVVYAIFRNRSNAFLAMRSQHLDGLAGKPGIGFDIGFISYFSNASVCDMSGLVNGRAWARESQEERARFCARQHPAFVFATPSQLSFLSWYLDLGKMATCRKYHFKNAGPTEWHYLLVEPGIAGGLCPGATPYAWTSDRIAGRV